jgi:hypothetical protein
MPKRMIYPDVEEGEEDELTTASNALVDLIHAGNLGEAEQAARALLERFLEVHDGYDRLGMVYEARGDQAGGLLLSQGHRVHSRASRK